MELRQVVMLLDGEILCGQVNANREIKTAFASDSMSDVATFATDQKILVTGRTDIAIVDTARHMNMQAIIVVRGKKLEQNVIDFAESKNISIISTPYKMFRTCGILYQAGIRS